MDEAGTVGASWHQPGRATCGSCERSFEAALVESDGDRLMVERALAGTSTGAEPERPSGLYDDARRDFDRRFYTALYVRFDGNLSQIAKAAGKQRVTVRDGPERPRLARGRRVHEQGNVSADWQPSCFTGLPSRFPTAVEVRQVMDEAVTATELIRDGRHEPLVEGFTGGVLLGEQPRRPRVSRAA